MSVDFELRPYFPPWLVAGAGVLLLALWAYAYRTSLRRRGLVGFGLLGLRCLFILALCALLLGPSRRRATAAHSERAQLSILLDTSASMGVRDVAGESRVEYAQRVWLAPERLQALERQADVTLYSFDGQLAPLKRERLAQPLQLGAADAQTALASSLSALLAATAHGQAVLVLSDGHDTTTTPIEQAAELARSRRIAVHTVALGGSRLQTDLDLHASVAQNYLFAREPGNLELRILHSGATGERTKLRVLQDGKQVHAQEIVFDAQGALSIKVPIEHAQPGTYAYTVELGSIAGEVDTRNNRQQLQLRVGDGRLRVLLLEGQPFWDTKFIATALRRDDRIELTQISRLRADKYSHNVTRAEADASKLPESVADWSRYDVVILGRGLEDMISRTTADALRQSIEQQGTQLVFARGRAYDPRTPHGEALQQTLQVLEPVSGPSSELMRRPAQLSAAGETHPLFQRLADKLSAGELFEGLRPLDLPARVDKLKAGVSVLLRSVDVGDGTGSGPLITLMGYGRGTVLSVLGEGLWQWKLDVQSDGLRGVHDRFWSNAIRWLALGSGFQPGASLALNISRQQVVVGQEIELDASYRDAAGEPTLELDALAPDGERELLALTAAPGGGRKIAHFSPSQAGKYRFVLRAKTAERALPEVDAELIAETDLRELTQTDAQAATLATLSAYSHGKALSSERPEELLQVLQREQLSVASPERLEYAWDHVWVMLALLCWVSSEWVLRRQWGLA